MKRLTARIFAPLFVCCVLSGFFVVSYVVMYNAIP